MFQDLQKILTQTTGRKDITPDTDFVKDLKFNSFDIINTISAIEDFFKIKVPNRDIRIIHTVRDALNYITARVTL